jgi:protoporphyrinogen oxidase
VRLYFGPTLWERWAEPLLASDLLADPSDASRVCFLLARAARGEAPLATLRGSPASVAEALWREADRVGAEASAVVREGRGLAVALGDGSGLEADAVVLALPARETVRVAGELLAPAEQDGLGAARTAPAIVVCAALERSPRRKATRLRVPTAEGLPLASIAVEPGGAGAPAPAGAALVAAVATPAWSRAHLQAADGVVEKELLGALGRIFPDLPGALRFCQLARYEAALPRFDVGRYRMLARLRAVQADLRARGRRLYFAGDHWVAPTLEGAIASGQRAAAEVREDFGLPARGLG